MEIGFLKVTSPVMVTLFWVPEKMSVMSLISMEDLTESELEMVEMINLLADEDGSKVTISGTTKSPSIIILPVTTCWSVKRKRKI